MRNLILSIIALVIIIFIMYFLFQGLSGKNQEPEPENNEQDINMEENNQQEENNEQNEEVTELKIDIIEEGTGPEAKNGDTLSVHYTGTFQDGTKFDSSVGKDPFSFELGAGLVIKGWDLGLLGMKVGGKRILTIPSDLGYGEAGAGGVIPPNSVLIFEVELLGIEN